MPAVGGKPATKKRAPKKPRRHPARRSARTSKTARGASGGAVGFFATLVDRFRSSRQARQFAFLSVVVIAGFLFWVSNGPAQVARLFDQSVRYAAVHSGFGVDQISVTGRDETGLTEVRGALELERGQSLLHYNLNLARQRLELLPWVGTAKVFRLLPDRLHVALVERRPVARWLNDGETALVDADGRVISEPSRRNLGGLPDVRGEGAGPGAPALVHHLKTHPAMARRLEQAQLIGQRRWDLHLKNGVHILLPSEGVEKALDFLTDAETEARFLSGQVVTVDMRRIWVDGTISLRFKDGVGERMVVQGKTSQ